MRHSTPCGAKAHACTLITPLPEARIGSVLPRIVPESGSVLKEGGQLVRSSAARCVEEQGVRRLPAARRRARGQAAEFIDLGSGAHVGLRKEEEEELRVLPRALAEALWAPTTSVRPAVQASWTSLLAPSQRTLTLGFFPKSGPATCPKSGPATWHGGGDVPNGQRGSGEAWRAEAVTADVDTTEAGGGCTSFHVRLLV